MDDKVVFLRWSMRRRDFVNMLLTQVVLIWIVCIVGVILPTGSYHNTFVMFIEGLAILFIGLLAYRYIKT